MRKASGEEDGTAPVVIWLDGRSNTAGLAASSLPVARGSRTQMTPVPHLHGGLCLLARSLARVLSAPRRPQCGCFSLSPREGRMNAPTPEHSLFAASARSLDHKCVSQTPFCCSTASIPHSYIIEMGIHGPHLLLTPKLQNLTQNPGSL